MLTQETKRDGVNLLALTVSAIAAMLWPLPTFILAYAVLGPFHYLTEIAWLKKKQFFFNDGVVSPGMYLAVAIALCVLASLDLHFRRGWTAYAVGGLLVLSLGALVKNVWVLLGAFALAIATRFFVHGYGLFLAAFVPTVVHVYFFTLMFLVSGVMRAKRRGWLAWLNPMLLLCVPVLLVKMPGSFGAAPGAFWMSGETLFAALHEYLAGLAGLGMHFDLAGKLEPNAVAVFRVLAFIYLHHYLNWFAKTELLAWHKVSARTWWLIGIVYAGALGSYAYSFAFGFYAAYFLSLLHVLLELPLNWHTGASLLAKPVAQWRERKLAASLAR